MDVIAKSKYMRMSATKIRDLARRVQGLPVSKALGAIEFSERKGALLLRKALKSAVGNAVNNAKLAAEDLVVREAVIEEGPALKRFQPRARGSAGPIRKRMCHIRVVLTDGKSAVK